jgi:uncharacterized protein
MQGQIKRQRRAIRSMSHRWRVAMNAYIYRLSVVHRRLDEEIRREARARFPDAIKLLRLKKLRLAVKDRLTRRFRDAVPA